LPGSALPAGAGDLKLAAAHKAFMQADGVQHDFPAMPGLKPPPAWIGEFMHALLAAAPVLKIVFWAAVALIAAALVWVIIRDLPFARRLRRRKPMAVATDWRPEAGAARALLDEADRLARSGQFADAIHLILFRSIEDIGARRPEAVRAALTSRDIVEAASLSEDGRSAFRSIAEAVERSVFGGRPAAADDFDRCRRQYEAFALAEQRS
jgi:hypothetical protein